MIDIISFLLLLLIFCALVSVIWSKEKGQLLFSIVMKWFLFLVCISVGIYILIFILAFFQHRNDNRSGPPTIGVTLDPIGPANSQLLGITPGTGVYVESVEPGGPAADAGIKDGDFILSIDGNTITSVNDISDYDSTKSIGDTVVLDVVHNMQHYNVPVVLGGSN